MNERVKQLAERAGDDWEHTLEQDKEFLIKFAQLIVEECASYMIKNYPDTRYKVNYMRKYMGDPNWSKPL